MTVLKFYQRPALSPGKTKEQLEQLKAVSEKRQVLSLETEFCYYVQVTGQKTLSEEQTKHLLWLLTPGFETQLVTDSHFKSNETDGIIIEIGPRLNFSTPSSTQSVAICKIIGLQCIDRIERSTRYLIRLKASSEPIPESKFVDALHDKMTEIRYLTPIETFDLPVNKKPWIEVDIMGKGRPALEEVSAELGLSFDDWDLDYYTSLFRDKLKRNPTTVECFDLAQSNSEHSRHWFFKGRMVIDGKEMEQSLLQMIFETQMTSNNNNVIKFSDNSSAIKGYQLRILQPENTTKGSAFYTSEGTRHIIFTAETHNFPTGVAPFSGATTGTGGRIRDAHAAGRGSHEIAGTAGYSFGNLNIPGYDLPWEDKSFEYPENFASPRRIAVEASNGASDYGNKFGEPVLSGFARSFGMKLPDGDRREWVKPIMFSGGIGSIDCAFVQKQSPQKGMYVVKIGGPVYRIGVGGGAASSVLVQGDQAAELDFNAVQRGDPEMEQKLHRLIRACIELGDKNPILSIHDQGAGGNGNVLKEIVDPSGAVIYTDKFELGDPTLSTLELWGAEYQESDAILISKSDEYLLKRISHRERCPVCIVGEVTGSGKIVLREKEAGPDPVDLDLQSVLGDMPRKVFKLDSYSPVLKQLSLPVNLQVKEALERVLRLPSVASKRYLTNKVDRCVTGLVAQQQCVGPLHTPLADMAVVALSYFDSVGSATAIGEQPIKGLLKPSAGARMSVAEALTNLMFAKISSLQDVKCSGNWMWAAKLPGEGAALYEACQAMCTSMAQLGIAIDGGKDSLSMAARVGKETVKAPGTLVVSTYAPCPDINLTVTPDLKCPAKGKKGFLILVSLSKDKARLGGTALAQCYNQLGDEVPDLEDPALLRDAFDITQDLVKKKMLTAAHDVSDGGVITCLLEMAFAGNCGLKANIRTKAAPIPALFQEEVAWILEVDEANKDTVLQLYSKKSVHAVEIGCSQNFGPDEVISVSVNGEEVIRDKVGSLRDIWEETSFKLEAFQCNLDCVSRERSNLLKRTQPPYKLTFDCDIPARNPASSVRVAVIRDEGINGDREMAASLYMAGFEVWDVTMSDLLSGDITLDSFRGIIFPGGFSYADVLGSARGWAAGLLFDPKLEAQFTAFKNNPKTFSLGVCNGCQLMGLLGWIAPDKNGNDERGVHLLHNASERFECRFSTVKIEATPSIMLKDMEGSVLGIWVAHGEGRFVFKNEQIQSETEAKNLVPLRYVDDNGNATSDYPFNPNGSVNGLAGICSEDGRHIAMMPHPERCTLTWQWPYMPEGWKENVKTSPWMKMFHNAYVWCKEH